MRPLYTHYAGPKLLETPLLNKSTAFTLEEREAFNLLGLLPPRFETMEEQVARAYQQFRSFGKALNQHIWLRALQDTNETLFFRLVQLHLEEMLPIVYTPTVGEACEHFSDIYRRARGVFISYADRHRLDDLLHNVTKREIKVIVVTDGERVLGLGDQGIGGMGISIGKLSLYTACGGISPAYTLPVTLDVGTDNPELLADPMYMGQRHGRIRGEDYDAFVDQVMAAFRRRWPRALVQFEDFAQPNAMPILTRWQDRACCFNDDIQGTAAVTLGTLLAASALSGQRLASMRVAIVGAGSAGCGIAEQIVRRMVLEGATEADARARIFMVDRQGLVTRSQAGLRDFQVPLAQPDSVRDGWCVEGAYPSLLEVVREAQPEVLIGVSAQAGLFTEAVVKAMRAAHARPIVFPLSNPSRHVEATPEQVLGWTGGDAIVATGSPFRPVSFDGREYPIAQCNNAYIFPGIGLGVISAGADRVDEAMLMAAATTLADASPALRGTGPALLPSLTELTSLSREIAFAVGKAAQARGHAPERSDEALRERIEANFWQPRYREYRRVSV